MKVNIVTLCSGYDSQALACERLKRDVPNFDYELIAWAEFDPDSKQPIEKQPAVVAHNALFPEWSDRNLGDITNADWGSITGDIDLLCYSTPCQSISVAGLQEGFQEGSGTRSSVIWSVLDAVRTLRPKYLLMENVSAMVSKKFVKDFQSWQTAISSLGYDNYTEILNAKDYGVAQNRPRVFMVSIRRDLGLTYHFPRAFTLERRLKDYLEPVVDARYYLSEKFIKGCIAHSDRKQSEGCGFKFEPTDGNCVAKAIGTQAGCRQTDNYIIEPVVIEDFYANRDVRVYCDYAPAIRAERSGLKVIEPRVIQVGNIWPDTEKFKNRTMGRVYDTAGISPTINCCGGGDREPKIVEGEMTSDNLLELVQAGLVRIRKLTARECFRLQGMEDCDIDKIQSTGISNSQQYKLAGNSIAISVLYHLFRKLFVETGNEKEQMTLF